MLVRPTDAAILAGRNGSGPDGRRLGHWPETAFEQITMPPGCALPPRRLNQHRPNSTRRDARFPSSDGTVVAKPTLGYPPIQIAEKPPSTDNSTPFTKLASSEARNSATVANFLRTTHLSPRDQGFRTSPSSPCRVAGNPACRPAPGLSTFTRIFLPFSSLSHVRANER